MVGVVLAATLALGGTALAGGLQHTAPGHDGTAVTSVGYRVTPAGKQTNLGDLPLVAVSSPDGRWLVVSNDGQGAQSLQVIDIATGKVTQTLSYPAPKALFVGLAFARDGKTLYASGGGNTSSVGTRSLAARSPKARRSRCRPPTRLGRRSTRCPLASR